MTSLISLLAATCLSAFALGYAKFFGYRHISDALASEADRAWIIQAVGALMTLGPVAAYLIAAPLTAAFRKRRVMAVSSLTVGAVLMLGHALGWPGTPWLYLFLIGVLMGVFSSAKMSCAPLESKDGGWSVFRINAAMSVMFIGGMLVGVCAGTMAYERNPGLGLTIGILMFILLAIPSILGSYKSERLRPPGRAFGDVASDTLSLLCKHTFYLLSSPLLWGVAAAVSLAVTAYSEAKGLAGPEWCAALQLFAAAGAVAGTSLSPVFERFRYGTAVMTGLSMAAVILLMPLIVEAGLTAGAAPSTMYWCLATMLVILAFAFGICTNLVDSEYLGLVGRENREGPGASLQSALTAFFSFAIGGATAVSILWNLTGLGSQFIFLSVVCLGGVSMVAALAASKGALDNAFGWILYVIGWVALRLRYRISVDGLDSLPENSKGVLILPNHPAEIDPVILELILWPRLRPRPVVIESFFYMPFFGKIIGVARPFCMPDITAGAGQHKRLRIQKALDDIAHSLRGGDNVVIYPAGMLTRTGLESIGARSGVKHILANAPECVPVLVRTEGLWGSIFSTSQHGGRTPDLAIAFSYGLMTLLRNLLLFSPRRHVRIHISSPSDFPRTADTMILNKHLEDFYNAGLDVNPNLVSYSAWRPLFPDFPKDNPATTATVDLQELDPKILGLVRRRIAEVLSADLNKIQPAARLSEDLGMDSLAKAELLSWVDDRFGPPEIEIEELRTVADVIAAAAGSTGSGTTIVRDVPPGWHITTPIPLGVAGTTVAEAFLRCCDRYPPGSPAIADETSGVLTRRKLKIAVILLARVFQNLPGDRLGVMLPASVAADLCCMACLVAKKPPVMLNWTTGRKNLEHAASAAGLQTVVTSARFMDRLHQADFGDVESMLVCLEDIRRTHITLSDKFSAWGEALKGADSLMDSFGLWDVNPDAPAVILFTSGSESVPKGVPLSHNNILSDLSASLATTKLVGSDILCGFLPPFHSFGFSFCSIAAMTAGLRTVHHPDPTEAKKIANLCVRWSATIMLGTPSFLTGILKTLNGNSNNLRLLVSGAERAADSLFDLVESTTKAELIEGYGITECSPVVTVNTPGEPRKGVGRPLPGVQIKIVHQDSHEPMPMGCRGLILVSGPTVFGGYIGSDKNPFLDIDGIRWYSTGDLGSIDEKGNLTIEGRLKRFVKIGGEMISLPAMEEALAAALLPGKAEDAAVAVCAEEPDSGRPTLSVFANFALTTDESNEILKKAGFSNLTRLSNTFRLDEMPLLGSGKTNYRKLEEHLKSNSQNKG